MTLTSLATRFRHWKNETAQAIKETGSGPNTASAPEWYAGLAVSPAAFSRQLGDMQASLMRANQTHSGATGKRSGRVV